MRNCWHEVPTKRPTFTELKSTLEHLLSQETPYIELTIDQSQEYYLLPTVKSTTDLDEKDNDDDDDDDDDDDVNDNGNDDDDEATVDNVDNDDDRGGGAVDNEKHSVKVVSNPPNTTEPRYKNVFEC